MGNRQTSQIKSLPVKERKRAHDYEQDEENVEEDSLSSPKRKKIKSTSRYIYDTLFINGENSDVQIIAYGREWSLHKVYLCQANYFSSMFSGAWKESQEKIVHMDIPDENIDAEALNIAFGSLYSDEVLISATKVISVLATATLLGLEGLIQQCVIVMQETTSAKTVCCYHEAAHMYGQEEMAEFCVKWLQRNIMYQTTCVLLADIGVDLMESVVSGSDLFVMQVEMDVYSLLKKWTFLKINANTITETMKELTAASDNFWKSRHQKETKQKNSENENDILLNESGDCEISKIDDDKTTGNEFLMTSSGEKYAKVFRALRIQHIVTDLASVKIIEADKIIPMEWLMPIYRQQWLQMVKVEQGHDKGPQSGEMTNFDKVAMRCGRVLSKEGEYCWRWTGYNYGIDLLVSFSGRLLIFKRNTHSQPCPGGVSLHPSRCILYKLTVSSLDSMGHPKFISTTGVKRLELAKDEESVILRVDKLVTFPLHISCQFLTFTPRKNFSAHPVVPP